MKVGDTVTTKRGVVLTVGSDSDETWGSFYFEAPLPPGFTSKDAIPGLTWGLKEAYVWLYFTHGYLDFYDMGYDQAWSGAGTWLLKEIRSLTSGKKY